MPLSDREQHLLEQMEQALSAEDPKFASHMRGVARGVSRTRYAIAGVALLLGLGLVLLGVSSRQVWLGVVGFVVMVAGVWQAVAPRKPATAATATQPGVSDLSAARQRRAGKTKKGSASGASFMQRLEERWDRRRDDY